MSHLKNKIGSIEIEESSVIIHDDDVMEVELNVDGEQKDTDEISNDGSWGIDPAIRSEAILKAAASGAATDAHINTLSESGAAGVAAAAAILSSKRRGAQKIYKFETNPALRKRQQTRLLRKIRTICGEYCTRVGQQAVFVAALPGRFNSSQTIGFKIIGSSPFDTVIRNNKQGLMRDLDAKVAEYGTVPLTIPSEGGIDLPPLLIDGIPTSIDEMTQAMLRNFIPVMLKHATARGKPGWGRESLKPVWWPEAAAPWANIRSDARNEEQKQCMSWTAALREIVKTCYRHFGREDLLHPFPKKPTGSKITAYPSPAQGNVSNQPNTIHQIITASGQQFVIAGIDSNGATVHIPISLCQISSDGSGTPQIQLVMPVAQGQQRIDGNAVISLANLLNVTATEAKKKDDEQ